MVSQKKRRRRRRRESETNRHHLDQPIGWGLCAISVFLLFATMRGKYNSGPLIPQLVPIFGVAFAIVTGLALLAFCVWQRSWVNLALFTGLFVVGFLLGSMRAAWHKDDAKAVTPQIAKVLQERGFHRFNYDWERHKWMTGICFASLGLGFKLLRENDSV